MSAPDTPRFNLPFSFVGSSADTIEQDTLDDIANCVEIALLTRIGYRVEAPTFGTPDFTFMKQPIGQDYLTAILAGQEPRASLVINEAPDRFDTLIDNIGIQVSPEEAR